MYLPARSLAVFIFLIFFLLNSTSSWFENILCSETCIKRIYFTGEGGIAILLYWDILNIIMIKFGDWNIEINTQTQGIYRHFYKVHCA